MTSDVLTAIQQYQQDICNNPQDAVAHQHLAMFYMQKDDYKSALQHFNQAIYARPNFISAHYNLGLLFMRNYQTTAAMTQFQQVLLLDPNHIPACFYLGALQINAQQLDNAAENFNFILTQNKEHVPSLINLGVIALKQDQAQIAITYFTQALALDENNIEARNNLAATFIHNDRFENALTHYNELLRNDPCNTEYLYNMGVANMALGNLTLALQQFETLLEHTPSHPAALQNLAAIKIRLGQRGDAIELLYKTLSINPNDQPSQFMLHALTGSNQNPEACHEYVKNLFNNYALHYESHLQNVLQYNLPKQILSILQQCNRYEFQNVLDLGCGTGLSGIPLREYSKQLTGIDLAPKMLQHARHKEIYDHLIEQDLISFLHNTTEQYDLIQALDVLPYFGDLTELCNAILSCLTPNGLLIISYEISIAQSWYVQDSMRFCHHPDYIQSFMQNTKIVYNQKVIARQENSQDLYVMLCCAQKL
jgi:predicted TPR repeat methyltransferase